MACVSSVDTGLELIFDKKIIWTIRNFDVIIADNVLIDAQSLGVEMGKSDHLPESFWGFSLSVTHQNHLKVLCLPDLSLQLCPDSSSSLKKIVHMGTASIIDANGNKFRTWETGTQKYVLNTSNTFVNPEDIPLLTLMVFERDINKIPLVNSNLVLEFTVELYKQRDKGQLSFDGKLEKDTFENARMDYLSLLSSGDMSDVTIVSQDGKEFHAHKTILRARCKVFDAMFRADMTETQTGVIELKDMSSAAVKFLLHFIYCFQPVVDSVKFNDNPEDGSDLECENHEAKEMSGEMKNGNGNDGHGQDMDCVSVKEVLDIAEKYGFQDLRNWIDHHMGYLCNEKNALYFFKLCKLYSLQSKKQVTAFISERPILARKVLDED